MSVKNLFKLKNVGGSEAFRVEDQGDGTTVLYVDGVATTVAIPGVTASAAEVNILDNAPGTVSISYAASATTDGIEATFTVKDAAGVAIAAVHRLHCFISRSSAGAGLTTTSASGSLTVATGVSHSVFTAKKDLVVQTDANGVAKLLLVDSANTTGERFCCYHPVTGKVIVGAATVGTDYEGGV